MTFTSNPLESPKSLEFLCSNVPQNSNTISWDFVIVACFALHLSIQSVPKGQAWDNTCTVYIHIYFLYLEICVFCCISIYYKDGKVGKSHVLIKVNTLTHSINGGNAVTFTLHDAK